MTISLMQSRKDYYSLAAYMQGSTRQVPLGRGWKEKEIADKLSELAKDAFFSLKTC